MRIYLIRHGEAEQNKDDFQRKLTSRGIEEINTVKHILQSRENLTIWVSSARRTTETYKILNLKTEATFYEHLYLATLQELLKTIWSNKVDSDLLIIGHNPGLSQLASYLLSDDTELSTGELIGIDLKGLTPFECSQGTGHRIYF